MDCLIPSSRAGHARALTVQLSRSAWQLTVRKSSSAYVRFVFPDSTGAFPLPIPLQSIITLSPCLHSIEEAKEGHVVTRSKVDIGYSFVSIDHYPAPSTGRLPLLKSHGYTPRKNPLFHRRGS